MTISNAKIAFQSFFKLMMLQPSASDSRLQIPLLELLRGGVEGAEFVDGAVGVHCLLRPVSDAFSERVGFIVLFLMRRFTCPLALAVGADRQLA
jgi:hypothetical protein